MSKPIPDFILNKGKGGGKGGPPPEEKGGDSPEGGKPEAQEEDTSQPPAGSPGKPSMPLKGKEAPPDAKTPPEGKGGPQPEGKGAPPEGPPPGAMPGPSPELQKAKDLLDQYVAGLMQGTPMDPSALGQFPNTPESPDPLPGAMSSILPKNTAGQIIDQGPGRIPSPGLRTGQGPAAPGVQLVGGLPRAQVEAMQMKMDGPPQGQTTKGLNPQQGKQAPQGQNKKQPSAPPPRR